MSRVRAGMLLFGGWMLGVLSFAALEEKQTDSFCTEPLAQSLKRIERIKPGKTRADLMREFTTEGGIQTGTKFVLADCPIIKVIVTWERDMTPPFPPPKTIEEAEAWLDGRPDDVLKSISRPYLQGVVID